MDKKDFFAREFIIGLGFISGLWIAIGLNPETLLVQKLEEIIFILNPNFEFGFMFTLIPFIATITSISLAYLLGGNVGLIAIFCSFIGGILFIDFTLVGVLFIVVGMLLGNWAVDNQQINY